MQVVLQHCCKLSWKAMLCILPPTFKSMSYNKSGCCLLQKVVADQPAMRKIAFYSFCGNVSKQVVCFCCPFKPQLFKIKEGVLVWWMLVRLSIQKLRINYWDLNLDFGLNCRASWEDQVSTYFWIVSYDVA